jgi:hypothetical protein
MTCMFPAVVKFLRSGKIFPTPSLVLLYFAILNAVEGSHTYFTAGNSIQQNPRLKTHDGGEYRLLLFVVHHTRINAGINYEIEMIL